MGEMSERMQILQDIEDGRVSAEEGLRRLDALAHPAQAASPAAEAGGGGPGGADSPAPESSRPEPGLSHFQRWWLIPLGVGIGLVTLAGLFMYWAYTSGGFGFWFYCASLPFALGVVVMALAAASRTAKWLHVRVDTGEDEWPRRINLSFPVPIRPTAWLLRLIGPFVPQLRNTALDELILALGESVTADNPLYVEVNEAEDGERVQVYIG